MKYRNSRKLAVSGSCSFKLTEIVASGFTNSNPYLSCWVTAFVRFCLTEMEYFSRFLFLQSKTQQIWRPWQQNEITVRTVAQTCDNIMLTLSLLIMSTRLRYSLYQYVQVTTPAVSVNCTHDQLASLERHA